MLISSALKYASRPSCGISSTGMAASISAIGSEGSARSRWLKPWKPINIDGPKSCSDCRRQLAYKPPLWSGPQAAWPWSKYAAVLWLTWCVT